ncbi:hypothetical protein [Streptomyces chiangmaiensis]|uniref:Uncharacterized protein n=1 Tax=Streptomyces chiangmaiensis TaxID=766497 RepID=A0ABU7FF81_9ACTN|nr:hypothetical protein [Streptomyces chiangmaiensis]MED7822806.1 hypothetical protein [Streptomyces chiangmaiensis]
MAEENPHFVRAQMALAGIAPGLTRFREWADASLAAARDALTELTGRGPLPL